MKLLVAMTITNFLINIFLFSQNSRNSSLWKLQRELNILITNVFESYIRIEKKERKQDERKDK